MTDVKQRKKEERERAKIGRQKIEREGQHGKECSTKWNKCFICSLNSFPSLIRHNLFPNIQHLSEELFSLSLNLNLNFQLQNFIVSLTLHSLHIKYMCYIWHTVSSLFLFASFNRAVRAKPFLLCGLSAHYHIF